MKPVFIYALNCPITGRTRYIGKTSDPKKRQKQHIKECRKERFRRANWINSLVASGLEPTLEVIDEVPFEHWQQLEVAYIEFFLEQGFDLLNGTPGGEDPPSWKGRKHTPEQCAAISARTRGKKASPETLQKLRVSHLGQVISLDQRAKISAALKGRKPTEEARAKMSAATSGDKNHWFGKKFSPEHRAKISAALKGRKHTEEARAKMTGRKKSPAECAEISERQRGEKNHRFGTIPWNKGLKNGKRQFN